VRTKGLLSVGAIAVILLLLFSHIAKIVLVLNLLPEPNGLRYAPSGVLVEWTRERRFAGTNFQPHKLLKSAQTPTTMAPAFVTGMHALLGTPKP
jgi:hypothetical protein